VRRLALLVAVLLLSGCVGLPTAGPVVEVDPDLEASSLPTVAIAPRVPAAGDSPAEIVEGFLDAMRAMPVQSTVAADYLTAEEQQRWRPGREVITYADRGAPQGAETVSLELVGAQRIDSRGTWRGALPPERRRLSFPLVLEDGEWRIADAPDALIIPTSGFEAAFRQVSLYFFDPTGQVLVPEPVFVPRGDALASTLVRRLLQGPRPALSGVARTFVPAGSSVGLSVPVSADGVAEVALEADGDDLPAGERDRIAAQLAWTMRQDPRVSSVRLTVNDEPVQLGGGRTRFSVRSSPEVDPAGYQASPYLFGLRDGLLVGTTRDTYEPVRGTLGQRDRRGPQLAEVAVDLPAARGAGVSTDRRRLVLGPVRGDGPVTTVVRGATDLLRPAWDAAGRLWIADRRADGAAVSYLHAGRRLPVRVPGVTGHDVRHLLVSRDGSRLVAVVRRPEGDRVVVSRIRADQQGVVLGATRAVPVSVAGDSVTRIADIAWLSPTAVLVLEPLDGGAARVHTVSLDGAPSGFEEVARVLSGPVRSLVSNPTPDSERFALRRGELHGLTDDSRDLVVPAGVSAVAYVG